MSILDTMLPQAAATGEAEGGVLVGHIGSFDFAIGGPDGLGGKQSGANPYDLYALLLLPAPR